MSKLWTAANADYLLTLQQLLPPGVIWTKDPDRRLTRLLMGLADELVRAHNEVTQTMEEVDPQTTTDLIAEWEDACGLPEFEVFPVLIADRRRVLVAKLRNVGGASEAHWEAFALLYGFGPPANVEDGPWTFYWSVSIPAEIHRMTCTDPCNSPLVTFSANVLPMALAFQKYKPAHTAIYWTDEAL